MKAITPDNPVIKLVPRFYPVDFTMDLEIEFTWEKVKNLIVITLDSTETLEQGKEYPFTLLSGQEIVYKGKLMLFENGTDIQNYTDNSQQTRWE